MKKIEEKSQKGFIQIPLLVAIIAGVLVLGSGGYFGVKQYQSYQDRKVEKEKIVMEQKQKEDETAKVQEDAKAAEVENLKREVEELKKSQAKIEGQKSSVQPEKKYTTSEIVSNSKYYIVNILCETPNGYVKASGISLGRDTNGDNMILTNYHVTRSAQTKSAFPPCVVGYQTGSYYYGQPVYYPNIFSQKTMDLIDFSLIQLKDAITNTSTYYYDEQTGQYIKSDYDPIDHEKQRQVFNSSPRFCSRTDLEIGSDLVVLGFPSIGGAGITVTEGIISSEVANSDVYFVSSAKIDQGNSGGGAFIKSSGCIAGMPTFAEVGSIESLGRMINLTKLKQDYLSKIFSSL